MLQGITLLLSKNVKMKYFYKKSGLLLECVQVTGLMSSYTSR